MLIIIVTQKFAVLSKAQYPWKNYIDKKMVSSPKKSEENEEKEGKCKKNSKIYTDRCFVLDVLEMSLPYEKCSKWARESKKVTYNILRYF